MEFRLNFTDFRQSLLYDEIFQALLGAPLLSLLTFLGEDFLFEPLSYRLVI